MDEQKITEINKLIASYSQSLPSKIATLVTLIEQLSKNFNKNDLENLRLKVHSIRGSAGVYGYHTITELAAQLELIVNEIVKSSSITAKQQDIMHNILQKMENEIAHKQVDAKEMSAIITNKINATNSLKKIIIIDQDEIWQDKIISELKFLDHEVLHYASVQQLLSLPTTNDAIIFMINLTLIDNKKLAEIKSQFPNSKIIYIAEINTFNNRLSAIKLSGAAFVEKPISANEILVLINRTKNLFENSYQILIIDDDPEVTSYYEAILKQSNIKVYIINNVKLTEAALHQYNPDLLLIDYQMPFCNGIELATIIRQNKLYENMPIIFLSAEGDTAIKLHAMNVGADDFINKSLPIEHIIAKIKSKINRYKMIKSLMTEDPLTGIFNATFIKRQLEIEIKECKKLSLYLTIALINIDKLNYINATYGFGIGDQVIKTLCDIINTSIFGGYIVGRYTNDEIMIILSDRSLESSQAVLEIIQAKFKSVTFQASQEFHATFSVGLATLSSNQTTQQLITEAAAALEVNRKKNANVTSS